MTTQATAFAGTAIGCLLLAAGAGFGQARRRRRRNPDAVGVVDWAGVQMAALFGAAIAAMLAWKA